MDVKDIGKKIENVELVEAMHAVRENENKDTLKQLFESVAPCSIYSSCKV